jgi:hypothetical protein
MHKDRISVHMMKLLLILKSIELTAILMNDTRYRIPLREQV